MSIKQEIDGQVSFADPIPTLYCKKLCICESCLYWWSSRCPYGKCYDDYRAITNPYDKAHPDKPPRTWWSDWNKDMEQAHWCRGGFFYATILCDHYVKYLGSTVQDCLKANVQVFQDGFMRCGIGENIDCETCYRLFLEQLERSEQDG